MNTSQTGACVLGIAVSESLLEKWRRWCSPALQPFPFDDLSAAERAQLPHRVMQPSEEERDTFFLYQGEWTWLDENEFRALSADLRRRLLASRRRATSPKPVPRWPSELIAADDDPLIRWVETGCRPSLHREVSDETWLHSARTLPRARSLAGTFPADGSGANCFATVLAAAGDDVADERWVQLSEFADWLREETTPVRGTAHDTAAGTVLVWRENDELAHAAVTIGDGWALVKPSQSWSSPRIVRPARELIKGWRYPGTRLERHRIDR